MPGGAPPRGYSRPWRRLGARSVTRRGPPGPRLFFRGAKTGTASGPPATYDGNRTDRGGQHVSLASDRHGGNGHSDYHVVDTELRGGNPSARTSRYSHSARTGHPNRKSRAMLLLRRLERSWSL